MNKMFPLYNQLDMISQRNDFFSVQLCGETIGSKREFHETSSRRDDDKNGCPRKRIHERQTKGKINRKTLFPNSYISFLNHST